MDVPLLVLDDVVGTFPRVVLLLLLVGFALMREVEDEVEAVEEEGLRLTFPVGVEGVLPSDVVELLFLLFNDDASLIDNGVGFNFDLAVGEGFVEVLGFRALPDNELGLLSEALGLLSFFNVPDAAVDKDERGVEAELRGRDCDEERFGEVDFLLLVLDFLGIPGARGGVSSFIFFLVNFKASAAAMAASSSSSFFFFFNRLSLELGVPNINVTTSGPRHCLITESS